MAAIESRDAGAEEVRELALGHQYRISDTLARNIGSGRQWNVKPPMPWPLGNCWLGVSVENQHWADERIPFNPTVLLHGEVYDCLDLVVPRNVSLQKVGLEA